MTKEVRILILEDQPTDAELAVRELKRAEIQFEYRQVDSKDRFVEALDEFSPDIILSDYALPQFTGIDALRILKERNRRIPFILCTGSLTEEVAVECMKEGASDYILKTSLKRLPMAVLNALSASESRRIQEEAVEALRRSEMEFRAIVETTNEWIWAVDLNGHLTYSNPAIERILGYSPDEVVGRSVTEFLHEEECALVDAFFQDAVNQRRGWTQKFTRYRNANGDVRYLESSAVPAFDANMKLIGYRGADRDITDRKLAEERIAYESVHDVLTGLANRTLFMTHLNLICESGRRESDKRFAVLLLNIDRFKVFNDSLGHEDSNELLKLFAQRLSSIVRPGDLVARLGADEFAILITQLGSESDSLRIIQNIRTAIHKTSFDLGEREVVLTVTIGAALSKPETNSAPGLLKEANAAMYRARSKGLGLYRVFNESMHQMAVDQLQLETDIRDGIKNKHFAVYYQPIVKLATGEVLGFEALARWNHPERGLVPPDQFIPAAEESGLIIPLSQWILEESCRQLFEWQRVERRAKELFVSVNLSPKQFVQQDLAAQISRTLEQTRLAPRYLKLEITEGHLMDNNESSIAVLQELRDRGVRISLDDFGTGYSSLSYLHRLPVDYIKIDRSFVLGMNESPENAEIVSTIIKLASSLKMESIAEGVEKDDQLFQLQDLGCDFGQGYFFARPLDKDEAQNYLRSTCTYYRTWSRDQRPGSGLPV